MSLDFSDSYSPEDCFFEQEFPIPPSINSYWKFSRMGVYVSKEGKDFRKVVELILLNKKVKKHTGRIALDVLMVPPNNIRRDVDNICKALLDALKHGGLYEDDSLIDDLRIRRCPVDKNNGSILVRAYAL